ncbi:MAG: S-layer homology domain-containing protein [Candidatus Peregrinibacteria bacterium]|nr:S-layer homology domain-containing protein [Candidatus Peregrinibacteria bacterium]
MAVKKSSKSKAAPKKVSKVTYSPMETGMSRNHKNFLAVLVLFAGFSLYTMTSFMNSNNANIKKMFADVTSDGQASDQVQVKQENPFKDLPDTHPAYKAVIQLYYRGVVGGYPDNTFRPDAKVNRAEFAKMLAEASDTDYASLPAANMTNCFNDLKNDPGAWYVPSVCAAKYKGWVNGYDNGDYGVLNNITKGEALKIVLKAFGFEIPANETIKDMPYNDVHPGDWYIGVAKAAKDNNVVVHSTVFVPNWELTRSDVAQILYAAMQAKGLIK